MKSPDYCSECGMMNDLHEDGVCDPQIKAQYQAKYSKMNPIREEHHDCCPCYGESGPCGICAYGHPEYKMKIKSVEPIWPKQVLARFDPHTGKFLWADETSHGKDTITLIAHLVPCN